MDLSSASGIRRNRAKQKLASGGYAFGTWLQFVRTPAIVRMIAAAGFDLVFIDMEHSSFDWQTIADMCEVARAEDVVPVVRPHDPNSGVMNRVQDVGAMGLMLHDVTGRDQVERAARSVYYPPRGQRGVTAGGAPTDYRTGPGRELQALVDEDVMLCIQIESRQGVDHIEDVIAGGDVHLVEIGRADLSTALGVPLEPRHPLVVEAIDHVVSVCDRHRIAVGVTAGSQEDAADLAARGVRCLNFGMDKTILASAYRSMRTALQTCAQKRSDAVTTSTSSIVR